MIINMCITPAGTSDAKRPKEAMTAAAKDAPRTEGRTLGNSPKVRMLYDNMCFLLDQEDLPGQGHQPGAPEPDALHEHHLPVPRHQQILRLQPQGAAQPLPREARQGFARRRELQHGGTPRLVRLLLAQCLLQRLCSL